MDYLFANIKIISAIFALIILPGLLLLNIFKARLANLDPYEKISYGLVSGMAIWIPIAWVSFGIGLNVKTPIYLSILITGCLILFGLYKSKIFSLKTFTPPGSLSNYFNIYIGVIAVQALFIGYTSQFQTGNSDALAHLAALRNLATFETIFSCDYILGNGAPMINTYGCNPWYLSLAMVFKLSGVDVAMAYATITGAIYFLSVLAIYTLLKAISGNAFISKIGSISFTVVSLIIWLIDNGNSTFNLNSHWIIFPQAIVNYVLFPILLAALIRYILQRDNVFLALTAVCLFALTRFHPNWLFWAPIIITGVVITRNLFIGKNGINPPKDLKVIFLVGFICTLSALGFFLCKNTYSFDPNLISPISLWRNSGGNLLYFTDSIYLYDPLVYLKSRGYFDIITIGLLWYLYSAGRENAKELLIIFVGCLAAIYIVIFNPLIVVPLVKIFGTPIPLYRAFELMWPALSAFMIYAVLAFIQLKSEKFPALPKIAAIVTALFCLLFFTKYVNFFKGVYHNQGGYYSTSTSPFAEPFATLRTLEGAKIAVRTPMATVIASLTNLDPITTEKWRHPTRAHYVMSERENNALLSFNAPYVDLVAIINKHKIRYIIIESADLAAINNFKKYPKLINFKVNAGVNQVWEIAENWSKAD
jgi:hypothetical protein